MTGKRAVVFGSTGLVGKHITHQLLNNPDYECVTTITRSPQMLESLLLAYDNDLIINKFHNHVIDFETSLFQTSPVKVKPQQQLVSILSQHDEVYLCLGSTIKQAKSKQKFIRIDQDYTVQAAKLAQQAGIQKIGLVSAIGSDSRSIFFYSRVKGDTEKLLESLNIKQLIIFQPSLIIGKRNDFRFFESMSQVLFPLLSPLMRASFAKYRPITAQQISTSLIAHMSKENEGTHRINFCSQ